MKLPIYFDYMATTPLDPRVVNKMVECLQAHDTFGNAASNSHNYGWRAQELIAIARKQVAELINAEPDEIFWTSGATESDNLALFGIAHFYQRKGKHIITCKTEHKAVLDVCTQLEKEGFEVTYLQPKANGLLELSDIANAIRKDTILISLMHANNEIGVIHEIEAIVHLAKQHGIIFHVDAAQSAGKLPIDVKAFPVDLISFSAHKVYGPKGIGALYIRQKPKVRLQPMIFGGGHEQGIRSGTLATHQIVGMGEAFRIAKNEMITEQEKILTLRKRFLDKLNGLGGMCINGDLEQRLAGNLNISFDKIEGESLLLSLKDIAVSSTSACSSVDMQPSYVLTALGLDNELAHSAIRLCIGRFTTEEEIDFAAKLVHDQVIRLRQLAP